jgi:hypothetical protein
MVPTAAEKVAAIVARIPAAVVNSVFFGFESKGTPQYAQKLLSLSSISLPHLAQFNGDLTSFLGDFTAFLFFYLFMCLPKFNEGRTAPFRLFFLLLFFDWEKRQYG